MAQDSIGYVLSQHHSDAQIAGSNFLYFATGPYQGYRGVILLITLFTS
jgi:hypothetical protein